MKKNYLVSGIKGEGLKGFTGKKRYNVDRVNCNECSSYINWLRVEVERALLRHQSIYPSNNRILYSK